jgi:hypothetical protein
LIQLLADENFDNRILRGLLRRMPTVDVVRVQDTEIAGAADPVVLAWAADHRRVLLTHDQRTIPIHVYERIAAGHVVAGVVVVDDTAAIGTVIDDLLLMIECSSVADWLNQVQRLPL